MQIGNIILYVYVIGMLTAFVLGCYEAYIEHLHGKDISQFPAAISAMSFMSWFYVYYFIKERM